jgi:hypothetical protein
MANLETDVVVAADSSTPAPNFEPDTYSSAELDAWQATGKLPSLAASTTASTDDAGAAQADEPATASATVPTTEQKGSSKGAEARKAELHAEIQELLKQRATLKATTDVVPPAPSPAPKVAKPVKPVFGEVVGETWEQFELRTEVFADQKIAYALAEDRRSAEKTRQEATTAAANKEIESAWTERVEAAKAEHADFAEFAFSKDVPISPVMDGFILDSDLGPAILYHLGHNVEDAKAIAAMTPYKAARALVAIEKALAGAAPVTKSPVVIPPTKAARPATDLRATNAAPADEMRAAVEADDFTRFQEIQNAKSVARRKQG